MDENNEILQLREEVKVLRKKIDEMNIEKSNYFLYLLGGNNSNEITARSL